MTANLSDRYAMPERTIVWSTFGALALGDDFYTAVTPYAKSHDYQKVHDGYEWNDDRTERIKVRDGLAALAGESSTRKSFPDEQPVVQYVVAVATPQQQRAARVAARVLTLKESTWLTEWVPTTVGTDGRRGWCGLGVRIKVYSRGGVSRRLLDDAPYLVPESRGDARIRWVQYHVTLRCGVGMWLANYWRVDVA